MPDAQEALLMEMEVPCRKCSGVGRVQLLPHLAPQLPCPDCGGSGTRKPLQELCVECGGRNFYGNCACGNGYVPNISMETMLEAIRAKGWLASVNQTLDYDAVTILSISEDIAPIRRMSRVGMKDGLRGPDALRLALERALEAATE